MLGDGIRRNLATVSQEERDLLIGAIKQLNQVFYPGARTDFPAGGVSYWFKQDEVHQVSHVHGCPQFLPWHREFCNRFESLLRQVNPALSLHYWDWNSDPSNLTDADGNVINLFGPNFMGNADPAVNGGTVGDPLLTAGFYNPAAANYRDNVSPKPLNRPNPNDPSTFSYGANGNPADPPKTLVRGKIAGAPPVGKWLKDPFNGDWTVVPAGTPGAVYWASDSDLINAPSWSTFQDLVAGVELGTSQSATHALAHQYIGGANGDLSDPHLSFRDPFVHSNLDRLWAMWQRQNGSVRLDPTQLYGADENTKGSGDVEFGDPNWGILSPLEPWSGYSAQTAATGIITNISPIRPWFAPENQQAYKDSKDLTIVLPPSYDTATHSSYVIANQDTFSTAQAAVSLTLPSAIVVIYDGFQPRELGTPTLANPAFTFTIGGASVNSISAQNPQVLLEDPAGAPDLPQRISVTYDIVLTNTSAFPASSGTQNAVTMQVALNYTVGGSTVNATDKTSATLFLVNQPSPYMADIDPTIPPPGPPNPYWLSTDTRVFKITQGSSIAGVPQNPNDPFGFITGLVAAFNLAPNDNNHPFLQLSADEASSQGELELSPTFGGTPVFNYAIAKVRYRGNVPAANAGVFFRAFKTMVSAADYDQTSATSLSGNYRRSGNTTGSVPLLGLESNEIASIPFFAKARVNTGPGGQSMTAQTDDPINTISFNGDGTDEVRYCGVWLDINDTANQRFPIDPASDAGGVNGPYQSPRLTIQQLMTGLHYCLVAEIFFWPTGTVTDPIPANATPASNDRLAQRNLSLDSSGNPGWPFAHTVQHTFMIKPSANSSAEAGVSMAAEVNRGYRIGPDELIIHWGNVPRTSEANLFFPEISADEILALSALRQHPPVLAKVDDHTISVKVAQATYIPIPARPTGNFAGLMAITLPQGVRVGQVFKMNIQQCSGMSAPGRALKTRGAFQFNIPVNADPEILPRATRNLSILRFIQQSIPATSRWSPIFTRWLDDLANKISGLGGDPTKILPSPTGSDHAPECTETTPCEIRPKELLCLTIPWNECQIEGEIEMKLRFRKKCN
jgi:hypothetical protein